MSSNPPPGDSGKPLAPATLRYLRAALDMPHPADEPFVLSEREARYVRWVRRQTLGLAALLGFVGMIAFYGPQRWWPGLFLPIPIQPGNNLVALPLLTGLYGLLIGYLEVYLLVVVNLRAVRHIMAVFHFPRAHDGQYTRHVAVLERLARKRSCRNLLQTGIDPHLGMPGQHLTLYFAAVTIAAVVINAVAWLLLRQWTGNFGVSGIVDWLGLPILALCNVMATRAVLRETSIRVMAPLTIREFVNELHEQWGKHAEFNSLILGTLQFAGVLAGQHNYAHLVLTETIVHRFALDPAQTPPVGQLLTLLAQQPIEIRRSIERLLIFSILIDGRVSAADKQHLSQFNKLGWLTHTIAQINTLGAKYRAGKGLWV